MTQTAIKICGISTLPAIEAAIAARASHVGLVFYAKSPRHVPLQQAAALAAAAKGRITLVGLFVDAPAAQVAQAAQAARLDVLQLHGHETPQTAAALRAQLGLPVWKALSVASAADVAGAAAYRDAADMVLFDAKTPKGTLPGGMGLVFDWSLLAGFDGGGFAGGWGLAGGLNPANVGEAIARTGTPLVDTSSGVESAPGVKDAALIHDFCAAVRAA